MNYIDVIGMLAGGLTTVSLVPQVLKIWRTRSANDISLGMFALFGLGVVLWLADGLLIDALPVIVANAVTLVLTLTIILMKWRFGG
ncbi:SemiSWEET transporter [Methyloterricola oryzae]|uniref:SemiSWEET transporter n=1 Tax=Methyloterricola oryzae TaxID=1495050 RepID=UPI0005EAE644|nr:SemiSWEET transporter [Methyloterricola oryzae]